MKLKTYQHQSEERIQQMKENMTAANLKYSQLLNEMNNNVNISHLKEKELIQKYQIVLNIKIFIIFHLTSMI